jgi:hypothetical protein
MSNRHTVLAGARVFAFAALLASPLVDARVVHAQPATFDHGALGAVLKACVRKGGVDYDCVSHERPTLARYREQVALFPVLSLPPRDRYAFWTNAYNAIVLEEVLANGRPASVMTVKGFFDAKKHMVAGERLTLNELEKKLQAAGEPRVHFVVNCASRDCPALRDSVYTGASWPTALEEQARAFFARSGEVVVDKAKKTITVNQIFEWYRADFGGDQKARELIAQYATTEREALLDPSYTLAYRQYDWTLNHRK